MFKSKLIGTYLGTEIIHAVAVHSFKYRQYKHKRKIQYRFTKVYKTITIRVIVGVEPVNEPENMPVNDRKPSLNTYLLGLFLVPILILPSLPAMSPSSHFLGFSMLQVLLYLYNIIHILLALWSNAISMEKFLTTCFHLRQRSSTYFRTQYFNTHRRWRVLVERVVMASSAGAFLFMNFRCVNMPAVFGCCWSLCIFIPEHHLDIHITVSIGINNLSL